MSLLGELLVLLFVLAVWMGLSPMLARTRNQLEDLVDEYDGKRNQHNSPPFFLIERKDRKQLLCRVRQSQRPYGKKGNIEDDRVEEH